jgi:hypothetical protein
MSSLYLTVLIRGCSCKHDAVFGKYEAGRTERNKRDETFRGLTQQK